MRKENPTWPWCCPSWSGADWPQEDVETPAQVIVHLFVQEKDHHLPEEEGGGKEERADGPHGDHWAARRVWQKLIWEKCSRHQRYELPCHGCQKCWYGETNYQSNRLLSTLCPERQLTNTNIKLVKIGQLSRVINLFESTLVFIKVWLWRLPECGETLNWTYQLENWVICDNWELSDTLDFIGGRPDPSDPCLREVVDLCGSSGNSFQSLFLFS